MIVNIMTEYCNSRQPLRMRAHPDVFGTEKKIKIIVKPFIYFLLLFIIFILLQAYIINK